MIINSIILTQQKKQRAKIVEQATSVFIVVVIREEA